MATDYKDYIVRYNIVTETSGVQNGLSRLAAIAKDLAAPLDSIKTSFQTISQSMQTLKNNCNFIFKPQVDLTDFNRQVQNMVTKVDEAAAKMHTSISTALNGVATRTQKQESTNKQKTAAQLKRDINAYKKEIDKLLGTPVVNKKGEMTRKPGSGLIAQAMKNGMTAELTSYNNQLKIWEGLIKSAQTELQKMESAKNQLVKQQEKVKKSAVAATASGRVASTGITPAAIREWKKVFGDAKSRSLTIKISASASGPTGALTVINDVKTKLAELGTAASFVITPTVNAEALARAKEQLNALSRLSGSVAAPLNGSKSANSKAAKTAVGSTKIVSDQIKKTLGSVKRPELPVNIRLGWANGAVGRSQQLKAIQEKLPPITINLDISKAVASLEELIAKIRAASPQTIVLNASSTAGAGSATSAAISGSGRSAGMTSSDGMISERDRKLAKMRENAQKLGTKQLADNRLRHQKRQEYISQQSAWRAAHQDYLTRLFNRYQGAPMRPDPGWAERAEAARNTELAAMREDAIAAFSKPTQTEVTSNRNAHLKRLNQYRGEIYKKVAPFITNKEQLEAAIKYRKYFDAAEKSLGVPMVPKTSVPYRQALLQEAINRMVADGQAIPWAMHKELSRLTSLIETKRTASLKERIARQQKAADRLRTQAYNSMLPFARTKEQANALVKYRRFFRSAIKTTGITPEVGMLGSDKLKLLNGVYDEMSRANIPIPFQLQKEIDALKSKMAGGGARGSGMAGGALMASKPLSERMRKWAYPFAGSTSLGAKTPMAVEMAKGIGVMYAIGGAMSAIGSSFSQAMEYQHTMRTTDAILKNGTDTYNTDAFGNMERLIRDVGIKTKFSAPEVANAARFLAMAGYDINAINNAIRPIADIALIGDTDLGETADKMTNIMTTFGIKPERMRAVANIMTTTATRSNTDLMMLAESAKYGGGVARLYGSNDPNLFADTMALFGIMGNAGIQASSAGTALRMMYQNIFRPNKNQKAMLATLKEMGVYTTNEDGSYRSMADIIMDMARLVPESMMPKVIGTLFRITAQPGAGAAILAAASGDTELAKRLLEDEKDDFSKVKIGKGLGTLASLMLANRQSVNSTISNSTAESKQNTISGLWAQVTSTFTEGIVKAFEQRQGGFEKILTSLRDYLAKPETVRMLQNILDMVIEIGKVLGTVAKIWASIYSTFPGAVKNIILLQMILSQFGSLILPFVQFINAIGRFRQLLMGFTGLQMAANMGGRLAVASAAVPGAAAAGSAATAAMATAPLLVGRNANGKDVVIRGAAAARARAMLANGTDPAVISEHYKKVQERVNRIWGSGKWSRGVAAGRTLGNGLMWSAAILSLKRMSFSILGMFGKVWGFITSPITAAIGALAGFGFGIYKFTQQVNGSTEAQIIATEKMAEQSSKAYRTMRENFKWYDEFVAKYQTDAGVVAGKSKSKTEFEYDTNTQRFRDEFADFYGADLSKDASTQNNNNVVSEWNKRIGGNTLYRLALGKYDKSFGVNEYRAEQESLKKFQSGFSSGDISGVSLLDALLRPRNEAKAIQAQQARNLLLMSGASDPALQEVLQKITDTYQKYAGKTSKEDMQAYRNEVEGIKNKYFKSAKRNALIDGSKLTTEQVKNLTDPSQYIQYWTGQENIIDAYINGAPGTQTGALAATNQLQTIENRHRGLEKIIGWQQDLTTGKINPGLYKIFTNRLVNQQTNDSVKNYLAQAAGTTLAETQAMRDTVLGNRDEWMGNIEKVIGNYSITFTALSPSGELLGNVKNLTLQMNNGAVDYNNALEQIRNVVKDYSLNLVNYGSILGRQYIAMVRDGLVDGSKSSLQDWIYGMTKHQHITAEDVKSFWINKGKNDPFRSGISLEDFTKFATSTDESKIMTVGNRKFTPGKLRDVIRRTMAWRNAADLLGGANGIEPYKAAEAGQQNNAETGTNSALNQSEYSSAYSKDMSKPTQVNINIGTLANFDRTSVSANAEEKDMMQAIENKLADVVYRVVAQAMNSAQSLANTGSYSGIAVG